MLIIIDVIKDFMPGGVLAVPDGDKIIEPINDRIRWHMANKDIIIMLTDCHKENAKEFNRFPKHAVAFTDGCKLDPRLDTKALFTTYWRESKYYHIPKDSHNGFYGTDLEEILEKEYKPYKPRPVEVAGVCTSICVMDTVGWLAAMGYAISIREECVADLTPESHKYALERMEGLYGVEIIRTPSTDDYVPMQSNH